MKKKSIPAAAKREIAALRKRPDSEIDYSGIPRQDPDDPKWKTAIVGRFYRPVKEPVALRLDSDVVAWLKGKGPGYQSRINAILRDAMTRPRPDLAGEPVRTPAAMPGSRGIARRATVVRHCPGSLY